MCGGNKILWLKLKYNEKSQETEIYSVGLSLLAK